MKNVLEVNVHLLVESDFRFDVTFKMAAMTSFHATKCCHLVSNTKRLPAPMQQFLLCSIFILVVTQDNVTVTNIGKCHVRM